MERINENILESESGSASEADSPNSLVAVFGDCWIDSPIGNVVSDVPDIPITTRSMIGARIGYDRTYDKVYIKATKTKNNVVVGRLCESLAYPLPSSEYLNIIQSLAVSLSEVAEVYKKIEMVTRAHGMVAARGYVTDSEFKLLESIYVQAMVVVAFLV